jgi:hypothetical protein
MRALDAVGFADFFPGMGPGASQRTGGVTTHWERAPVRTRTKRILECLRMVGGRPRHGRVPSRAPALRRAPRTVVHSDGMACAGA